MSTQVEVTRKCGHVEYYKTFYTEGSKNWKNQAWKEKGRLCEACRIEAAKAKQEQAFQTFADGFPAPPAWEFVSTAQLNFAEASWAQALGSVPADHPGLPELLAFAEAVSGKRLSAGAWLDAWMEVRRDWPFEPWSTRWVGGKKTGCWLNLKSFMEGIWDGNRNTRE